VIRVGFISQGSGQTWLGGTHYFQNIINAITSGPGTRLEAVIFCGHQGEHSFGTCPDVPVIRARILDIGTVPFIIRMAVRKIAGHDILLERLLKKHGVSVLSHSGSLGMNSPIPTIGWIADFQHKYYPDFFSRDELEERDRSFRLLCRECSCIILSSQAARSDAERFFPEYAGKYRVLHFVAGTMDLKDLPPFELVREKYQIGTPYFIVPNQFWVHKNHDVILEALKILHDRNQQVIVISTGNTQDRRYPGYFDKIQNKIRDYGISDQFRILGIIPYRELLQLMIHANAVINPSLFEGWSTTVEEAKSLGAPCILSDIPVHREQNPDAGIFFPPHDPGTLAEILRERSRDTRTPGDRVDPDRIMESLHHRMAGFIRQYEQIVTETVASGKK
jgi:glycosyltransferase involved in cell wall biosynthesis